jgi:hypothetical protein
MYATLDLYQEREHRTVFVAAEHRDLFDV